MSLHERTKRLNELNEELGIRNTTIMHALSDLTSWDFINKREKRYELTSIGFVNALLLKDMFSANEVLSKQKDFWLKHDISGIPQYFLKKLGTLRNAYFVRSNETELDRVHKSFLEFLLKSKEICGISPIFHKDYVKVFKELIDRGATVELIFTEEVLGNTLNSIDPKDLKDFMQKKDLRIFVKDDLKVALTVTNKSFSLGLFTLDGNYDYTTDIISEDIETIEWGKELFNYHLQGARNVFEILHKKFT